MSSTSSTALSHAFSNRADYTLAPRLTVYRHVQELDCLVGSLVATKNLFEAERLLACYVLTRRNALSSTAAIEYALINVSSTAWIVQDTSC